MPTTTPSQSTEPWYALARADEIASPALLVYPERVEKNLRRMIAIAGDPARMRPHVKTHKTRQVTRMKLAAGIDKFKCSTIAEAEMVADCGGRDILLAYPQVGPNAARFAALAAAFPDVRFSTVTDDAPHARQLSSAFAAAGAKLELLLDLDNGMHRSGVEPGPAAIELYRQFADLPAIAPGGLHLYDGQLRDPDIRVRTQQVTEAFVPVDRLRADLVKAGLPVPRIVAGGSGSFPVHARRDDLETSPGTCVFWDINYRQKFPELDFLYAAVLLGRVVSKPGAGRLCVDLGYKAVSPDNPYPRLEFLDLGEVALVNHTEEHLSVESSRAGDYSVGDPVYAIPYHVCPTVNLQSELVVVEGGRAVDRWPVVARERKLTY